MSFSFLLKDSNVFLLALVMINSFKRILILNHEGISAFIQSTNVAYLEATFFPHCVFDFIK